MANALNDNNNSLSFGALIVEFYYPDRQQIFHVALMAKINHNYGEALVLSYYLEGVKAYKLVNGTWSVQ